MHFLLDNYINAKYKSIFGICKCPNCNNVVEKKSQNHVFCGKGCKNTFWIKIRGYFARGWGNNIPNKQPLYPGGYSQWKIDLKREEETIAENILLGKE